MLTAHGYRNGLKSLWSREVLGERFRLAGRLPWICIIMEIPCVVVILKDLVKGITLQHGEPTWRPGESIGYRQEYQDEILMGLRLLVRRKV